MIYFCCNFVETFIPLNLTHGCCIFKFFISRFFSLNFLFPFPFSFNFHFHFQAMKSCDVDLTDSDTARLALRFDEEESRRVHIQKFMRFVRGE